MVSPLIDEAVLIDALKPADPDQLDENVIKLRSGAALLLVDAFDRKATRDQFIAALGAALGLSDIIARYETMMHVKMFEKEHGCVTKADIEVTMGSILPKVKAYTDQCAKMATLLQQCPLNEDKVH